MKTFLNIRGTNGSGKSTLARSLFGPNPTTVSLVSYLNRAQRTKLATGRLNEQTRVCVVGDYSTMAGGLDKLPSFEVQLQAVESALSLPNVQVVVAEGVLASTVLGSWAAHAKKLSLQGHRVVWAFLTTPVEVCLARIQQRNGGKPIKENLVRDKWNQIDRVRQRAELIREITVVQLPFGREKETLQELLCLSPQV